MLAGKPVTGPRREIGMAVVGVMAGAITRRVPGRRQGLRRAHPGRGLAAPHAAGVLADPLRQPGRPHPVPLGGLNPAPLGVLASMVDISPRTQAPGRDRPCLPHRSGSRRGLGKSLICLPCTNRRMVPPFADWSPAGRCGQSAWTFETATGLLLQVAGTRRRAVRPLFREESLSEGLQPPKGEGLCSGRSVFL